MTTQLLTAAVCVLAALYFVAGKLGLTLAFVNPSATAVWPCSGIALAALLMFGYRVWPGIFLGAFAVNLTTAGTLFTSVGIAAGNTLEGLAGAWLVNRWAGGRGAIHRTRGVFAFMLLGAILSTTVSATLGVTTLFLGRLASGGVVDSVWWTWWLGDAVGVAVVAPFLLLWLGHPARRFSRGELLEFVALLSCVILIAEVVFNGALLPGAQRHSLEYLCIPILMWAAFRFGPREAAAGILVLSAIAIWGTLHGRGPFARESLHESLLLLQAFLGVVAVTILGLAAEVSDRRRAERDARTLAVSDPLTGLGNYRRLIDALESEIERSARTGRSFALLLMDVDGLKKINDVHGHLVGSRALCRLADILRVYSRSTDTPARYGGDEFALVLPEAGRDAASEVARRIRERLTADAEYPALSVSLGIAVCPSDGETKDELLREADAALYEMKKGAVRHTA